MDIMGKRLQARLDELGWSQMTLAERTGVSQAIISQIKLDRVENTKYLAQLASELGVRPDWLRFGKGPKLTISGDAEPTMGPSRRAWVPLISWVQAGDFCEAIDLFAPGEADEYIPTHRHCSRHTYALRVQGNSMTSSSSPSFPAGTVIICDPDKRPENGSFVIAKTSEGETTFKRLELDAGKRYLVPLNDRFPVLEMDDSMVICSVVISAVLDF